MVLVRHGGTFVRVHSSRLQFENSEFTKECNDVNNSSGRSQIENKVTPASDHYEEIPPLSIQEDNDNAAENGELISNENEENVLNDQLVEGPEVNTNLEDTVHTNVDQAGGLAAQKTLPVIKSSVIARPFGSDEFRHLKIVSRAGKVSGKYANWLNVIDTDTNNAESVNWDFIEEWKEIPNEEALISENFNPDDVFAAKLAEIERWKEYQVFEEVENNGQKAISTRWVNTEKDGKIKSRLVARGYECNETNERVDSPTCEKSNLRLVITIAASKKWRINSLDIQSAFLQGQDVTGDIYLIPPKEFRSNTLWKLRKHVYGLKQASRKLYIKVLKELENLGVQKCKMDEALFYWHCDGKLEGLIAGHVDDFFWCGTDLFQKSVIDEISKIFKISSDLHDSFTFLGLQVHQSTDGIQMSQSVYAESIQNLDIPDKRSKHTLLSEQEKEPLRSVIGQLCWLANQSRPDISSDVCQLSAAFKNAKVSDINFANKTIRKVKLDSVSLSFPVLDLDRLRLEVFSDSSFNNLPNSGSQGGHCILLCDGNDMAAPIQWKSRRIRRVVKSTLAAETLALEDATDNAYYIKCVLIEVLNLNPQNIGISCSIDNKSLYNSLYSSTNVKEDRRLIQDISLIKEMIYKNEITSVQLVESKRNIADALTKRGASSELLVQVVRSGNMKCLC